MEYNESLVNSKGAEVAQVLAGMTANEALQAMKIAKSIILNTCSVDALSNRFNEAVRQFSEDRA